MCSLSLLPASALHGRRDWPFETPEHRSVASEEVGWRSPQSVTELPLLVPKWRDDGADCHVRRCARRFSCNEPRGFDRLLRRLADSDGSDLHLKVGSVPRIRVHGDLIRLTDEVGPQPAELEGIAREIMPDRIWEGFEKSYEADFAYAIMGLGRFRVNAYRQRGSIGMVFRLVRSSARSPSRISGCPKPSASWQTSSAASCSSLGRPAPARRRPSPP